MRIIWLTDIHLDYLFTKERRNFLNSLAWTEPAIVLVGGDISKAASLADDLRAIRKAVKAEVYFVTGNHDYFGSSFSSVREKLAMLAREQNSLHWLENMSHVSLVDDVVLVGHGCWGDAGIGSFWKSELGIKMPDFREISDFKILDRSECLAMLKTLGEEAAGHLKKSCLTAAKQHRTVIVLTHVPPFPQTVLHEGEQDDSGLPFFCCLAAGEVLREVAESLPDVHFIVFFGHTHCDASARILPNLEAIVQGARYHMPDYRLLILENGRLADQGRIGVL
ncbi:MAG: phosphoesterase [Deltaproteobacteria bacterium]|nr:phosphoesterase [Deltaproteobacteria bacterium]